MSGMKKVKDKDINQVCHSCAQARGWKPKDKQVGMWMGVCDSCQEWSWLCAPRDYHIPGERPATTAELLMAFLKFNADKKGKAPD